MGVKKFGWGQLLALVLLTGSSSDFVLAQSAGEQLVRREVLNHRFEARVDLTLYEEPERMPFIPVLWQRTERTGETIAAGERVRVVDVKESALGLRRFVWLKVETEPEVEVPTVPLSGESPPPMPGDEATRGNAQEGTGEEPEPDTMRGWLRLGGQHRALGVVLEQLEAVPERPPQ